MDTLASYQWILLSIIVQLSFQKNGGLSSSTSIECSVNFYVKDGKCTTCPDGFLGHNCSSICPYPGYGRLCIAGKCACSKELCDPSSGCFNDASTLNLENIKKQVQTIQSIDAKLTTVIIFEKTERNPKELKEPKTTSSVTIALAVAGSFIIIALLAILLKQRNGYINIRKGVSKRGSHVTSQRHVDTYCEIDDGKVAETDCKMWSESEVYESIDRSNKETTKYTELPKRQGTSKANQCISMQQILDEADDDDTGDEDDAEKNKCQVRVQMRKGKELSRPANKRIGKTSTKISGYIDMTRNSLEDYVSMAPRQVEGELKPSKDLSK
ncbi:uncharacterized protein LOC144621481 [Crassostrea virginica]